MGLNFFRAAPHRMAFPQIYDSFGYAEGGEKQGRTGPQLPTYGGYRAAWVPSLIPRLPRFRSFPATQGGKGGGEQPGTEAERNPKSIS